MKTIALRFSNSFAPPLGTILAHDELISQNGFVWYGKLGNRISEGIAKSILQGQPPRILLIHSGATNRYWAYVDKIQHTVPELASIPSYYRERATDFKTWFRVIKFEAAPNDIMSKCFVASSGKVLSIASRHSMSPYFIIEMQV